MEEGGYTFCVEKALAKQVSFLKLDITYMGFTVDSDLALAGGSCGSSCSTGCGH